MALVAPKSNSDLNVLSHNIEFVDCEPRSLARVAELAPRFVQAVKLSGATYLSEQFEQFEPEGVTGVVVVAESHFSIHTWPEHGLAVIDVLTCSEQVDIDSFVLSLAEFCKPKDVKRESINRVSIDNS